jgi:hypothetical protein
LLKVILDKEIFIQMKKIAQKLANWPIYSYLRLPHLNLFFQLELGHFERVHLALEPLPLAHFGLPLFLQTLELAVELALPPLQHHIPGRLRFQKVYLRFTHCSKIPPPQKKMPMI